MKMYIHGLGRICILLADFIYKGWVPQKKSRDPSYLFVIFATQDTKEELFILFKLHIYSL